MHRDKTSRSQEQETSILCHSVLSSPSVRSPLNSPSPVDFIIVTEFSELLGQAKQLCSVALYLSAHENLLTWSACPRGAVCACLCPAEVAERSKAVAVSHLQQLQLPPATGDMSWISSVLCELSGVPIFVLYHDLSHVGSFSYHFPFQLAPIPLCLRHHSGAVSRF